MGAHYGNNHANVWELFEQHWTNGAWEMPDRRCKPGRHRRPVMSGMRLLSRARVVVPLLLLALASLVGCVPSDVTSPPPAPATTGPTPAPPGGDR